MVKINGDQMDDEGKRERVRKREGGKSLHQGIVSHLPSPLPLPSSHPLPLGTSTPKADLLMAIGDGRRSPALEAYLHRAPGSHSSGKSGLDEWSDVALEACDVIGRMLQSSLLPSIDRMFSVVIDLLGYSRSREHFGLLTPDESKIQYTIALLTIIGTRGSRLVHLLQGYREGMHHFFGFLGYLKDVTSSFPKSEHISFPDAAGILGTLRFLRQGLEDDYLLGLLHPGDNAKVRMEQLRVRMGLGPNGRAESWKPMETLVEELKTLPEDQSPDLASLINELEMQIQDIFSATWDGCVSGIGWGDPRGSKEVPIPWLNIPIRWMGPDRCFVESPAYERGQRQYIAMEVDAPTKDGTSPVLCIIRLSALSGDIEAWTLSLQDASLKSLVFLQCQEMLVGIVIQDSGK